MESQPQNGPAAPGHDWKSLLTFKDIQFLSLQDSYFPVKRRQDVSPLARPRIPKSYVPSVDIPSAPVVEEVHVRFPEVDKKTDVVVPNVDEEDARIRACSIPRPRAVISSPDNDAMIGHKNRTTAIRPAVLTNNNSSMPNRHARCKVLPTCTEEENPGDAMNSKDIADAKTEAKGKKGSVKAATSQRRKTVIRKPSPMRI